MVKTRVLTQIAAVVLSLGLMAGCATTDQLKQMQADIEANRQAVGAAQQTADEAKATADAALKAANEAKAAANDAQAAANMANERADRMLEKRMSK